MPRKAKTLIDEVLDKQYLEFISSWKPKFGLQDDIDILNYENKLKLKSNTPEQINSLKSKIIYLLKKKSLTNV
jgi:hypothetical protein